jgi:hypothetical protein
MRTPSEGFTSSSRPSPQHFLVIAHFIEHVPHFRRIATFDGSLGGEIAKRFVYLFYQPDRRGLVDRETAAINSVKPFSNVSEAGSGTVVDILRQFAKLEAAGKVYIQRR